MNHNYYSLRIYIYTYIHIFTSNKWFLSESESQVGPKKKYIKDCNYSFPIPSVLTHFFSLSLAHSLALPLHHLFPKTDSGNIRIYVKMRKYTNICMREWQQTYLHLLTNKIPIQTKNESYKSVFRKPFTLSDECLKHETQGHRHNHVIYIYIYIYIYSHSKADCFVVSQLFRVARHVRFTNLGSKPGNEVSKWKDFKYICNTFCVVYIYQLNGNRELNSFEWQSLREW